jgi:predicted ATPase/DNA-binding winged helix-turn-helix (wHTH) protein
MNDCFQPPADAITFGPFALYPTQRRLLRRGQPVQLGSRAFELLLVLVENAGALVRKDELIARVWPDTHVEQTGLRVHIAALRKVLGDGRTGGSGLVNIPGRGYQFVEPISVMAKTTPPPEIVASRSMHHLPSPLPRVIGRDDEIELVATRLGTERCITLTGTGGIGKTTVARVIGQRLAPHFEDGAFFVDLAPLSGGQHVVDAIATAVGAVRNGHMSAMRLAEMLGAKNIFLLLDNCEHVAAEVAEVVANLTDASSRVRILITSREPLHVPAEHVYRLPTLKTPSFTAGLSAMEAIKYPAIELFVERAAASADRFTLDDTNAPAVAAICVQLDGLALAIEMAATRMDAFGVGDIAVMLEDRFRVLRQPHRGSSARHASLSATLDWSYDMLQTDQRAVLHRIAAFSGRFTVEDAVAVAGDRVFSRADAAECLADLVDKSFIMVDGSGVHAFYRLYETMREYARHRSLHAGDLEETQRRHAQYMTDLFARAQTQSEQRNPSDWLAAYGRYLDDVRAALDWSMKPEGDAEIGISLTVSAVTLWTHLSLLNELQRRVELALNELGPDAPNGTAREMKLFAALSYAMVNLYGPTPQGSNACRAALEIARKIGNYSNQAKALDVLWNGCFANGEVRLSLKLAEQFMSVANKLGPADVLVGHRMIGSSHFYLGDVAAGRRHMETMVAGYGATAHEAHMARFGFGQLASAYGLLAFHLCFQGYFDQAMEATRRSVKVALSYNHALTACGILGTTSIPNAIYTGNLDEARRYVEILYEQARSHSLQCWENFACGFDGIICAREGQLDEGLLKLSRSVSQADDRANTRYMFIFSEHALALGRAGHPLAGLNEIEEVLERLVDTGERWYLPELHRCRAELLRMGGRDTSKVEGSFRQALSLAEEMSALNWRLLAAKDFTEFLRSQGRQQEGFDILSSVYNRFTEGHDCPELQKTRARLLTLGGPAL